MARQMLWVITTLQKKLQPITDDNNNNKKYLCVRAN